MNLGTHYFALSVKNIEASLAFYQKLGFLPMVGAGSIEEQWLILENGTMKIGLFQGMFPQNMLTFNPENARRVHEEILQQGIPVLQSQGLEAGQGSCHFAIEDPDGNKILFDEHG